MSESECFSCGALVPDTEGPVHRYMDSSPGCWAIYGQVLAREYSDASYFRNHRLTVDAYALQHPGEPSPQTIQSIALHLGSLHLVFDCGSEPGEATALLQELSRHKTKFCWLEPPSNLGSVSVLDVWTTKGATAHLAAVRTWATATWSAWEQHHAQVQAWVRPCALKRVSKGTGL